MLRSLALVLIFLAGWTVAANLLALSGGSLETLMWVGPACMALLSAVFLLIPRNTAAEESRGNASSGSPNKQQTCSLILAAIAATLMLRINWYGFWFLGVATLALHCVIAYRHRSVSDPVSPASGRLDRWVVLATMLAAAALALAVNRSDADDAFYVGVAAFAHVHPNAPLLAVDPMHGEPGWPLLFPSYRFASYELLAAALAKLFGMSAMNVMYRMLPPLGAAFVVASAFFLGRQLAPRRWLLVGLVTVALGLILGECHRGFGNFMFVRIFQGKSIYVSALMPLIFALTFRCTSREGNARDVMLLACAQLAAIGLSNFGMLAAPLATGTALAACMLTAPRARYPRLGAAACTLLIPLPYLLYVAVASHTTGDIQAPEEAAPAVWIGIFGGRQEYLVALLLLAAPALAPHPRIRAWLAVPPLILLGVLLNPWLAHFISYSVTTAPVYWRVTWCLPVLSYLAWGICAAGEQVRRAPVHLLLGVAIATLLAWSSTFGVLRSSNGVLWQFAGPKIPPWDYAVAERVAKQVGSHARVLAPESVSSVIARFEDHPRLVLVRDLYLHLLRSSIGEASFAPRMQLQNFVDGSFQKQDVKAISAALKDLDVETVVTTSGENPVNHLLASNGYALTDTMAPYVIWRRMPVPTH